MANTGNMNQVKALKKSNNDLKRQLEDARRDIQKLQYRVEEQEHVSHVANGGPSRDSQIETEKSLTWLHETESEMRKELNGISKRLDDIEQRLEELDSAMEELQNYSYAFNVKVLQVPELKPNESAEETSQLCVDLFNSMGVQVSLNDIDIAHRVSYRDVARTGPKPIVCKFVRRLVKNQVMAKRKDASAVNPTFIGLQDDTDLSHVLIVDHLTPQMQRLYSSAKEFKERYEYKFCWARNGVIYLRRTEDSRPLKVRNANDLSKYAQDEQGQLS